MTDIVVRGQERRIIVRATVPGQTSDSPEQIRDKLNSLPDGYAYIYNQLSSSSIWIVNHNLGYRPSAELRSSGGQIMFAEIIHISDNQLQVLFDSPVTGQLRLN